jgi:hypothetical protein
VDVLYYDNMKAIGLSALMTLYNEWQKAESEKIKDESGAE